MAQRRRVSRPADVRAPASLMLDSEGLSKGAAGDPRVRQYLEKAYGDGVSVTVSSITLTETLRGRPTDAQVRRVLAAGSVVVPVSEEIAAAAGALLGRTARRDTVDAVVAVTASREDGPVILLTSDPTDPRALTEDWPQIKVMPV